MTTIGPITTPVDSFIDGGTTFVWYDHYGGDIWIGEFNAGYRQWAAYEFTLPAEIPDGSTISSATLVLRGSGTYFWSGALVIYASDADDPSSITGIAQRPSVDGGSTTLTTASVRWPASGDLTWNSSGGNTAPDLKSIIQELVDSYSGLASGVKIILWLTISDLASAEREVAAPNNSANNSLTIEYSEGSASAVPVVWGEESPSEGTGESWSTWKTLAGDSPIVNGDSDWGKLDLTNLNHYSPVKDTGNSRGKRFVVKRDVFGTGLGTVNIYIRGSTDSFLASAETPSWELYSAPVNRVWRYVQIKTEKV